MVSSCRGKGLPSGARVGKGWREEKESAPPLPAHFLTAGPGAALPDRLVFVARRFLLQLFQGFFHLADRGSPSGGRRKAGKGAAAAAIATVLSARRQPLSRRCAQHPHSGCPLRGRRCRLLVLMMNHAKLHDEDTSLGIAAPASRTRSADSR